eukprot:9469566-Pyramimonas_sp.AAC.2
MPRGARQEDLSHLVVGPVHSVDDHSPARPAGREELGPEQGRRLHPGGGLRKLHRGPEPAVRHGRDQAASACQQLGARPVQEGAEAEFGVDGHA